MAVAMVIIATALNLRDGSLQQWLPVMVTLRKEWPSAMVALRQQSRSSKAEHPADNRKTAEHYRAGLPAFAKASARQAGFCREQMVAVRQDLE